MKQPNTLEPVSDVLLRFGFTPNVQLIIERLYEPYIGHAECQAAIAALERALGTLQELPVEKMLNSEYNRGVVTACKAIDQLIAEYRRAE